MWQVFEVIHPSGNSPCSHENTYWRTTLCLFILCKSIFNIWGPYKTCSNSYSRATIQGIFSYFLLHSITVYSIRILFVKNKKCPVCNHGFNQNGNLRRHQQKLSHYVKSNPIHSGIRVKIVPSVESQ